MMLPSELTMSVVQKPRLHILGQTVKVYDTSDVVREPVPFFNSFV